LADKVNVVAVMLVLIIREPLPRASLKTRVMRMTRPAVDNFVKNFFKRSDFEYSGTALVGEIHTEKFKISIKSMTCLNLLRSFLKPLENQTTALACGVHGHTPPDLSLEICFKHPSNLSPCLKTTN
jgi:hypothetical protein